MADRHTLPQRLALLVCGLVAALATPLSPAQGTQPSAPPEVGRRLADLLARQPKDTQIGLVVAEAATGNAWFEREPDASLKPASLFKLLVTAAALERLGPQFHYDTRAYLVGSELWVLGAGDPALGDARLAERNGRPPEYVLDDWAAALKARGIPSLSGLVLDDTVFETAVRHPDWPDSQADRWYQAVASGLNYADNCLDVRVRISADRITLETQPDVPPHLLRSRLTAGRRNVPEIKRSPDDDVFELTGTVTRTTPLRTVAVRRPTLFFGQVLKRGLEQRGITVRGDVVIQKLNTDPLPPDVLLATHTTTLPDIVWRCNTFSQNLFADCLLKSLAAYAPDGRRAERPGSWEAGAAALRATLPDLGLNPDAIVIRDGSGLSHSNRVTPRQLVTLLQHMWRHRHRDVFLDSLAVAGEPGSMHHGYGDALLRGRLRGKTGSLDGVRGLAGYLTRSDGTVLAFALLINGTADDELPQHVCKLLLAD